MQQAMQNRFAMSKPWNPSLMHPTCSYGFYSIVQSPGLKYSSATDLTLT